MWKTKNKKKKAKRKKKQEKQQEKLTISFWFDPKTFCLAVIFTGPDC